MLYVFRWLAFEQLEFIQGDAQTRKEFAGIGFINRIRQGIQHQMREVTQA